MDIIFYKKSNFFSNLFKILKLTTILLYRDFIKRSGFMKPVDELHIYNVGQGRPINGELRIFKENS